jgi:GNAT superfamily N-acetyltransferase
MSAPSIVERNVDLTMVRADLDDLRSYQVPDGHAIRAYAPGDEMAWVEVQSLADAYNVITPALFRREYGDDPEELARRLFMLIDPGGTAIGSAAAWFGQRGGDPTWGRVHWVAIHPTHQGRGLAKPLLSRVCATLRELGHARAYLTTGTARVPAIALYLHFGFAPAIDGPADEAAWGELLREIPDLARRLPGRSTRRVADRGV